MEKKVLAGANSREEKYFLSPEFSALPESIQEEVRVICVLLAEKLACIFLMGFYENGELYFETIRYADDFDFDEIGAELEIKEMQRSKKELLHSLQLWYTVFCTQKDKKMKEQLLQQVKEEQ